MIRGRASDFRKCVLGEASLAALRSGKPRLTIIKDLTSVAERQAGICDPPVLLCLRGEFLASSAARYTGLGGFLAPLPRAHARG
jgi:hypothetical protein